jgi:hypothetical protein
MFVSVCSVQAVDSAFDTLYPYRTSRTFEVLMTRERSGDRKRDKAPNGRRNARLARPTRRERCACRSNSAEKVREVEHNPLWSLLNRAYRPNLTALGRCGSWVKERSGRVVEERCGGEVGCARGAQGWWCAPRVDGGGTVGRVTPNASEIMVQT